MQNTSLVYVSIDGIVKGHYSIQQEYRKGLKKVICGLKNSFQINLLSGDNDSQKTLLQNEYGISELYFNQSPIDKLKHLQSLQKNKEKVMMIGDGLNDAGALKQSDFGLAISEDVHQFSPACDAILDAKQFEKLNYFLSLSKKSITIIHISFIISFLYNIIGLCFAVSGNLSPIIAAILMPLSSISVVVFTSLATQFVSKDT